MLTIPPEIAHFSHSISVTHEATIKLFTLVNNIDGELMKIDQLLHAYQPQKSGKICIVFKPNRHGTVKPVVARWVRLKKPMKLKSGVVRKWKLTRLSLKNLPRNRKTQFQFKKYEQEVRQLLIVCGELMKKRMMLVDGLLNYRKSVNAIARGNMAKFLRTSSYLSAMIAELPAVGEWERTTDDVPDKATAEDLLGEGDDDDVLDDE